MTAEPWSSVYAYMGAFTSITDARFFEVEINLRCLFKAIITDLGVRLKNLSNFQ